MSKELIRLANCTMAFDDEVVLDNINLYINDKEFLTLLGPSGCGKTTTLRIIGGFQTPTSGDIFFDGVRINAVPPHKRAINTVFQKYALFPHLNVYENIAFGLRIPKTDEKGKKHKDADSPKYKALGNSIALPFWDWMLRRMARYLPEDATLGSLFDGISGFNVCWARIHGAEHCRWSSEIEQFPIAVTKKHFGDEEAGKEGDWWKFSGM